MRVFKTLLLTMFATLFVVAPALAHTDLVSKTPEEDATLKQAPGQVRISFSAPVEAEFSPLEVYDEQGRRVDLDDASLKSGDATTLMVDLRKGLSAGFYTVEYRFTGDDGHTVTGSYEFAIAEQREASEPTIEETTVDEPVIEETTSISNGVKEESSVKDEATQASVERSASEEGGLANRVLYVGLGIVALAVVGMLVARRR